MTTRDRDHRRVWTWARRGPNTVLTVIVTAASLVAGPRLHANQTPSPSPPRRIISLVPAVTEMLFAMGAGEAVVGVSSYDHYPPAVESRQRVGALVDPDFERILALRPDLVVVYGTQNDLITRLGRANVPTFNYQHAGLADITSTMRRLGARVGHVADANREADRIEGDLAAIRQRVAGAPRPSTALIFGREAGTLRAMFASGGIGFLHDMLEVAGGTDAFGDIKRENVQLSAEMLLARAPEVILELRPSENWDAARLARERDVWKALPALPAVRDGRVYLLANDVLLVPGPRVAEAVRMMADVLHPARAVSQTNSTGTGWGISFRPYASEKNRSSAARPRVP